MGWKIAATLDFIAMFLVSVGTPLAAVESTRIIGGVILAVAGALKAANEILKTHKIVEYTKR